MRVILKLDDGSERRIDTPDPALVGLWLKAIFDEMATGYRGRSGPVPTTFVLEVW
jgi:hypothetical protein